jgi:hypothetical protein
MHGSMAGHRRLDRARSRGYRGAHADVAEPVDARDLKSCGRKAVRVRVPPSAPPYDPDFDGDSPTSGTAGIGLAPMSRDPDTEPHSLHRTPPDRERGPPSACPPRHRRCSARRQTHAVPTSGTAPDTLSVAAPSQDVGQNVRALHVNSALRRVRQRIPQPNIAPRDNLPLTQSVCLLDQREHIYLSRTRPAPGQR